MVLGPVNLDFLTTSKRKRLVGIGFPVLTTNTGGFFSRSEGPETVMAGLKQLILTTKGERPMLPNFGTNLRRYVFEPYDTSLVKKIQEDVLEAVRVYAPWVKTTGIDVSQDNRSGQEDRNVIYVRLYFEIIGDLQNPYLLDLIV